MNRPRHLMFAALTGLAVLGCSDTASAQPQLTLNPVATQNAPLVFNNVPSGGVSPSQTITVGTSNGTSATVIIQVSPSSPWLVVTPGASVNVPATLSVHCNTANLASGGYNGSFNVTVDGAPTDFVTVYVSLNVTGVSQLSANPQSLSFSAQAGASSASPNGIQVQIQSSGMALNYNLQATTGNGANWLLLSALSGSTSGGPFTVSVNPSGLTAISFPAIFNGTITATSTTTADAVIIPVQVTLTANAQLSVTPTNPPPFLYQSGSGTDPTAQQLSITAVNGPLAFSLQESPAVSWLVPSALGGTAGTTPDVITLSATPAEQGLQPGTYTTSIVVTPSGEPALPAIPVSLIVAAHPLIQTSVSSLSFTAAFAGSNPAAQSVILTSPGGAAVVGFTVSTSSPWLIAGPATGSTPATLTVQVNTVGLAEQTYNGTVTITPANGDQYTQTIAVTLDVSGASQLIAGPASLLFSYETGQTQPPSQTIEIQTTSLPLTFTLASSTSSCGSNWLQAQPSSPFVNASSNTTLTVSVVTTGLTPGTCSGTVTLNYFNGLANSSLPIMVTLAVSSSAELSVSVMPGFGLATASQIGASFQQQISLTSTDPSTQVSYNASLTNVGGGGQWLSIGATNGTTPQNLDIQYNPAAVNTPGTYTGTVTLTSPSLGAAALSLPVSLTVTSTTSVTVAPTALTFTQSSGGSPAAAQTLTLSSGPGVATFTAVVASITGGNWLQISPTSGSTNGPVTVTVLPLASTFSPGAYTAQISFAFQGAETTSATVNVTLNVTAPQTIAALPTSLSFTYQIGGTAPASQQVAISASAGTASIGVSATSSGWLSVSPTSGSTPQSITVSVNPQGLTAQTYSGSVSVTAPGVLAAPLSIPVSFNVISAAPPQITVILNNATNSAGAIAPGEELDIKGTFLGPSTPASGESFTINAAGGVNNTLAGVQVMFDNNPGTPIFVSAGQIDVMVPYEINGRLSTTMVVMYNGVPSASFPLSVVPAAPGLYTNNFSGTGQAAALNQNNSFNGTGAGFQAAPRGTVVALFGTGGGQSNPISITGSVTPIPNGPAEYLNLPNTTATIGGIPATVQFAGEAPGEVTGVFQINVLVPSNVTPGSAVPVVISIGGASSPIGTTIAVD